MTAEVEELTDLLLVHLRDLEKALPQQDADKLKGEHDKFLAQKTLRMETLRNYCNLDYISDWSRYKSGLDLILTRNSRFRNLLETKKHLFK